ncbi:hypothetical protein KW803_00090 [Candidatus Saccharibacteria bacterium]|nr:hypothetical protein [Candidatus Saccharibacteria bacterium]
MPPTAEVPKQGVARLVKLEGLCKNCACESIHSNGPDFVQIVGVNPDTMSTILSLSSSDTIDGREHLTITEEEVAGIRDEDDIAEAFNNCVGAGKTEGVFVCGAIASLKKRGIYGRKEILAR